jgi:hypothetical protein
MLNYSFAMKRFSVIFILFLMLYLPAKVLADGDVAILSPKPGEGIKGRVVVSGYIKVSNYTGYEMDFSDEGNAAPGWYPIISGTKLADDGVLGIWDTTGISDGNYSLRLVVTLKDGSTSTQTITGLRVRNYSTMETSTPGKELQVTIVPTIQPTSLLPTAQKTVQPAKNPAAITSGKFQMTIVIGIVLGFIITFFLFSIFNRNRSGQ